MVMTCLCILVSGWKAAAGIGDLRIEIAEVGVALGIGGTDRIAAAVIGQIADTNELLRHRLFPVVVTGDRRCICME
jgi:hypothetical protein